MRAPTPIPLLSVWERGGQQSSALRALSMLAAAGDGRGVEDLCALPLGQRDALLLELRELLFGDRITGTATCPGCGSEVEASFRIMDLLPQDAATEASSGPGSSLEGTVERGGFRVRFRLPNSMDLMALDGLESIDAARTKLLSGCVLDVVGRDRTRTPDGLPPPVAAAVAEAMASADPRADLNLTFTCPDCGHGWETAFDIAGFLWEELQAWAPRLLREVDLLARTYHWRESDILALSARRRQTYLELCTS